jgi:signal transduction histidine kinase
MNSILPRHRRSRVFVTLLGSVVCAAWAISVVYADGARSELHAAFDADGRTFAIRAPGFRDVRGGFSATIERDGRRIILSSKRGDVIPLGFRFPLEGIELYCRLGMSEDGSAVLLQSGVRNIGSAAFDLVTVSPVTMTGLVEGNPAEWLVTALGESARSAPPVVAISDIQESLAVHEYGGVYRRDGTGFLFGPVGEPIAYVDAKIAYDEDAVLSFALTADMSGVRVDPGESRWAQQVTLVMAAPRDALALWADGVAETHGARHVFTAQSGWVGSNVGAIVDAVQASSGRLRPAVIQMTPSVVGVTSEDVAQRLRRIAAVGARSGRSLTFAPSGVLLPPGADLPWSDLIGRARQAVLEGATYINIDCAGLVPPSLSPTRKTSFETMRSGFARLREAVGPDVYLVHGGHQPDRSSVGAVDASQTGTATAREGVRQSINDVLRSYALHDRWFDVDVGVYFLETHGRWPLARTWTSMVGLSGGTALNGELWNRADKVENWRSVEILTPPAAERMEVPDLGRRRHWPRLVGHVSRPWGAWSVALLWNPGAVEQSVELNFAEVGLQSDRRYAVWSFWDNRFLGVAEGSWSTPLLAPMTSQHLAFTELDREPERAVLIGSSLHIWCGAAEIDAATMSRSRLRLDLTDAGAREGDLFIYSRWPLFLKSSTGCAVTSVEGAGENVWRVRVTERKRGVSQRIELGVLVPAHMQAWFWVLIATALASLMLTAWRYLVGLRLEREHALEQERTRIAGDIHDEVGANLTQISILSSLAARSATDSETARGYSREVHDVARQTIQSLEEIVWSINPKRDSLISVAHFICRRAEELMDAANVSCRNTIDVSQPERQMKPRRRHGLLLAVKEALHNILKHAEASHVQVSCLMNGKVFEVSVADDGCGFDQDALPGALGRRGNGLDNMHRRLSEIEGECIITSGPDKGTQVRFRLAMDIG